MIEQENNYEVLDSDDDLMITTLDKSIINTDGDEREFLCFKSYDINKEIKIDSDNLGVKNIQCILKA